MQRIGLYLIGLAILAGAGVFAYQSLTPQTAAPQIAFTTLTGEKFTTADLRGKVVLVNFWATSCVTCVKEMPELVATYERFKARGFETVAVAMAYDPPNYVLNYAQKNALPFKVALDTKGEAAQGFGNIRLTPTTFVIDKRGNIVTRFLGEPNFADLHKLIDAKLAEPA